MRFEGLERGIVVDCGTVSLGEWSLILQIQALPSLEVSGTAHPATEHHIIIIFIYCNWVVTQWQWLFYMYTEYEIGY